MRNNKIRPVTIKNALGKPSTAPSDPADHTWDSRTNQQLIQVKHSAITPRKEQGSFLANDA